MTSLFLLCGLLCDDVVWRRQAADLAGEADVTIMHFAGFDSIGGMAEAVLARAPARFSLAGHSMGARVALEVYRRAPQRVERLALLDTGYEPMAPHEPEKRGALVNRALADGIDAIARDWALPMLAPRNRDNPALVGEMLAMVGRMSGEIYAGQTRALLGRPDATALLPAIACPTMVLCGEEDGWSPPERHERMARLIPNSTLRVVPGSGHMSPMETPEAITEALREWLRETAAAPVQPFNNN